MPDKIVSRPSNQAYRDGWDRVFNDGFRCNPLFSLCDKCCNCDRSRESYRKCK